MEGTGFARKVHALAGLYEKALNEVGEDNAAIFEIHQMMLEDEDYLDAAASISAEDLKYFRESA